MPKKIHADDLRIADVLDGLIHFKVKSGNRQYGFTYNAKKYWDFMRHAQELLAPHVGEDKVVPLRRH